MPGHRLLVKLICKAAQTTLTLSGNLGLARLLLPSFSLLLAFSPQLGNGLCAARQAGDDAFDLFLQA